MNLTLVDGVYSAKNGNLWYIIRVENRYSKEYVQLTPIGEPIVYGTNSLFKDGWGEYTIANERQTEILLQSIQKKVLVTNPIMKKKEFSLPSIF